jgi:methyl-accepting chemotaxis protein
MKKEKKRRKLRNLLIRKEIQLALVLLNLLFVVVAASVIILVVLPPIYGDLQSSDNVLVQNVLAKLFILLIDRLIVALGAILVLGVIYTLIITHRVCGPLENFCQTFQRISQGDLTRKVFLRRNDFLKYEARQVNDMIDSLSLRIDTIKQKQQVIKFKAEELSKSQCPDIRHVFSELASAVDACNKTLGEVKIIARDVFL